ncbi:BlaI/MecI/CopY family transcriptional regulator [Streptomyces sp. SBST2-5]|uniref:BlaI/MecI/CopY family transcriptional regulator n=2 Tax=Streptomyces composti TaxID=2720025 RepID=A0ABX1AGH1_9ACTN|nr:BlaI/MecI/CopY family transcriptional regulator [Streptomyces composti]
MPRPLGELEDAVMTRVWKWNRPVTVREVLEDLQKERSIAYTTVMTVLDNLHQKGWVRREAEGRAYRYEAVSTRAAYAAALMNDAWSQSDNPAAALVAFFGMMSDEQRKALTDAIRIAQLPETTEGPENPRPENPGAGGQGTENAAAEKTGPENTANTGPENAASEMPNAENRAAENETTENPGSAQDRPGR